MKILIILLKISVKGGIQIAPCFFIAQKRPTKAPILGYANYQVKLYFVSKKMRLYPLWVGMFPPSHSENLVEQSTRNLRYAVTSTNV